MYVSDCDNDRIAVLDPLTGNHIRYIGRGQGEGLDQLYGPVGVMMQPNVVSGDEYHLYVMDCCNDRIQVFNPVDGNHIRYIDHGHGAGPGQLSGPRSCAALLGPKGGAEGDISELYVSEENNNRVSVFDIATGAFKRHIGGAGQMDKPQAIALSRGDIDGQRGNHLLYVSDTGNDRIQIFDARTGAHIGFMGVGTKSFGLKLHAAKENRSILFVSEGGKKRIHVYEV